MKPVMIAIDRSGNLQHQASEMLDVLRCLLDRTPCIVTVFDTERKEPKYFCEISYRPVDAQGS